MSKKVLTGEYNRWGYELLLNGESYFQAGNVPWSSFNQVHPSNPSALPLKTIKEHCIKTGKADCKEHGWIWGDAEEIETHEVEENA